MFSFKIIPLLISNILIAGGAALARPLSAPPPRFVSSNQVSDIGLERIKALSGHVDGRVARLLRYGVRSYHIVYKTTYKGKEIEASGLALVPVGLKREAPIICLQHGTSFVKNDVPSLNGGDFTGMELFASAGYIAIAPDFIGYGKSSGVFHPYYDKGHSAMTVVDMIKSVKEFLVTENVAYNDKLFLAGYSEGGYVTLAAAEEIETNPSHGLALTAVVAGAGGYDLTGMLKGVSSNSYYSYPAYLAFVLMSYNTTYDWNKSLTYFFKPSCADALSKYMDGKHDGWFINQRLSTNVNSLFNETFYDNLQDRDKEEQLKRAILKNTIRGWKATAPIRLYHGTRDEIIPYENSEVTLKSFRAAGAENISLKPIPGGSHSSSFGPMMQAFIPWFHELAAVE